MNCKQLTKLFIKRPACPGRFFWQQLRLLSLPIFLLLVWLPIQLNSSGSPRIRIQAVGDIMLGTAAPEGFLHPDEKGSILKYLQPYLQIADLTVGNLEGTLCDSGVTEKCEPDSLDCYVFRMPEKYGGDLQAAGFDFLSLANNHVGDFGDFCRNRTEEILDSLNIGWSGRPGTVAWKTVRGVKIAFVAFHSGGYCNSSLDIPAAVAWVSQLKQEGDLVLVSLHGGAEGLAAMSLPDTLEYYMGEPRGQVKAFAHAVIEAGADLVFGHGPHIARAMELYRGRLIAYSLGNFATYGRFNLQAERRFGGILDLELTPDGSLITARLLSIEQKYWGVPLVDRENHFARLVDSLSRADIPEYGVRIQSDGRVMLPD